MNKARRKSISSIIERIEALKEEVDSLMSDEQEFFDNMPENFQIGEKGEAAQASVESMQSAIDSIDEVVEYLNAAVEV